jgi:cytochrome b561
MKTTLTSRARYDRVAIFLHWSIALLIAAAFVLGLTVDEFGKNYEPLVVNAHSLLGLGVLLLTLIRIGWRLGHPAPPSPQAMSAWMKALAGITHTALYALMLAVPLIGLPTLFYRGRGLDFGLFQMPAFLARSPEIFRPLTEIHELGAYALVALAAGHIAAALYHQWYLRDGLVRRMMPSRHVEDS